MGAEQGDPQNPPPSDGQPGARQPEEGQPGDKNQSEQEQPNNPQEQQPGTGKKPGGLNLNNQPPPTAPPGEQPQVDNEANLEYAKRATDLVLERLKQEQKNPADQQQLLQHLGWTPDQLDAFVKRWESLRAAAQAPGVEGQVAKRELEESLKSLGLSRRGTAMAGDRTAQDHVQGMEQSQRTEPPKKYRDSFRAFSRGIMQSKRGGK